MKLGIVKTAATSALVSLFVAAAVVTCSGHFKPNPTEELKRETPVQIAADAKAATVVINLNDDTGHIQGTGSGWFINDRGDIMTADHVASKKDKNIEVVFADGTKHKATVMWENEKDDASVLHVDDVKNHKYLDFGDSSKLKVGDPLVVVGNPLNLGVSASFGHVSQVLTNLAGLAVMVGDLGLPLGNKYVQTDAAINPGNSGGPVLNAAGQVIGMADMAFSSSNMSGGPNVSSGLNMLVPSNVMTADLGAFQKGMDALNFLKPTIPKVNMEVPLFNYV